MSTTNNLNYEMAEEAILKTIEKLAKDIVTDSMYKDLYSAVISELIESLNVLTSIKGDKIK